MRSPGRAGKTGLPRRLTQPKLALGSAAAGEDTAKATEDQGVFRARRELRHALGLEGLHHLDF